MTYIFDSQPAGTFLHSGTPSAPNTSFTPSVVVFQKTGLPTSPHSLTVTVGPDSVFLLDYIVFSQESDFDQSGNSTGDTAPPSSNKTVPINAPRGSPSPSASQCVNSAYTSVSVDLLANQCYLPFAGTLVLALASFCVRCPLDLNLIRSFNNHCLSPVACPSLHPTFCHIPSRLALFLLDVVSPRIQLPDDDLPRCSPSTMHLSQHLPRASMSSTAATNKSHNVATFAGAIGGSVGLLTVLALSLAFSIYRRRLHARRRDRAYRRARRGNVSVSTIHSDDSDGGPPMQGPQPFVPRYFPGTIITTTAPPPYSPPTPTSPLYDQTSALLGAPETPQPLMAWSSRRTGGVIGDSESYADRPPPTPSNSSVVGLDVDEGFYAPPPPFLVAIATPVPAILAGLSGVSSSPSPAPATSSSPPSRPTTPASPVIPLLPPPPSSRPASLFSTPDQTPGAGPSGSQRSQSPQAPSLVPTPLAQPVVLSQLSARTLHAHTSEDTALGAHGETNSIPSSSLEPNQAGMSAPVLISPISSITDSQSGTGVQERGHRSEEDGDSTH